MHYIEISSGLRKHIQEIRQDNPHMSIPDGADLTELGYAPLLPAVMPALAPGEYVTAGPDVNVGGVWRKSWTVNPAPDPAIAIAEKTEALWEAADRYTSSYISGVAIGILTIGVMMGRPKCQAVAGWSGAVWAEYYRRKMLVTADSTDSTDSADSLDFSSFGPIPYSVPELQEEVGM